MLRNYLKSALRYFARNKAFAFINIFGLAVGIAVSITGLLFVHSELNFDRFNKKADRIFRIAVDALSGNTSIYQTYTPAVMAAALYDEFPQIEKVCRIATFDDEKFEYANKVFLEDNVFVTDSTFLDIFSFKILEGEVNNLLSQPYVAVLTRSAAERYFGNESPLGKILKNDTLNFKVVAVVEDVPQNSHFHFNILLSLVSYDGFYNNPAWFANNFRTYILLHKNADPEEVSSGLAAFTDKYLFGGRYSEATRKGNKWELYLQPLTGIHLNSDLRGEFEPNGRKDYVYIFLVVSIFILVIACINFINLSTARAAGRAREVGVRKTAGAFKSDLFWQFMSESLLTSFLALILGVVMAEAALELLRESQGLNLSLHYFDNYYTIPALVLLGLLVGFVSGIYPALILASFKPVSVLKNQLQRGRRYPWMRAALVSFQFAISIFLILGTFIIYKQLSLIQNDSLGFDKENIISVKNPGVLANNSRAFKNELLQLPYVKNVSSVFRMPGEKFINLGFGAEDFDEGFTLNLSACDESYLDVMKLELLQGHFFSKEYGTDTMGIVINQSAVSLLGYDDPIGKTLHTWGNPRLNFHVIGVIKDIYYESRHQKVMPMGLVYIGGPFDIDPGSIAVRLGSGDYASMIGGIEKAWNNFSPSIPFNYSFFDKDYDSLYNNEMQTRKLFIVFSLLSIFIASLGLLGLAAFVVRQRTREVGLRKVFGASDVSVLLKMSKGFTFWVLLANLLTWPFAWYFFDNWLNNFAYRSDISWWYFPLSLIITLIITLMTVSFQSIKAARINPAIVLRWE